MGVLSSPIDVPTTRDRLDRLRALTEAAGVYAVVVSPGSDLRYLIRDRGGVLRAPQVPSSCPTVPRSPPASSSPKLEYADLRPCSPSADLGRRGSSPGSTARMPTRSRWPASTPGPSGGSRTRRRALHLLPAARCTGRSTSSPAWPDACRRAADGGEDRRARPSCGPLGQPYAASCPEWGVASAPGRTEREVAGQTSRPRSSRRAHARAEFVIVGSGPKGNGVPAHHHDRL